LTPEFNPEPLAVAVSDAVGHRHADCLADGVDFTVFERYPELHWHTITQRIGHSEPKRNADSKCDADADAKWSRNGVEHCYRLDDAEPLTDAVADAHLHWNAKLVSDANAIVDTE